MLTLLRDKWQNVSCECAFTQCRAYRKNTSHKRRPQTFGQRTGACITYLVTPELYLGDGLVYLVVFSATRNAGTHLAARMLPRTNTQLRSPRFTPRRACESDGSAWRPLFPVPHWARSVSKCCAGEAMCTHRGMASRRVPRTFRLRHTTQTSTLTRSLPVLREQFQPVALPLASRRNTNLTSTDCDAMTTWILTPNHGASLATHRLKIRSCAQQ